MSWLNRYPEAREKIVAMIHIEHFGEMNYREVESRVEVMGLPEQSYLWVQNNQRLIDMAIQTAKTNDVRRIQVVAPEHVRDYTVAFSNGGGELAYYACPSTIWIPDNHS